MLLAMSMGTSLPDATGPQTGGDPPPSPNLDGYGLAGGIVTALAAGPITFVFGMIILTVQDDTPAVFSASLGDVLEAIFETSKLGVFGGGPAALVNTLLLAWLALRGRDRIAIAIASGAALGALIGFIACMLLASVGDSDASSTENNMSVQKLLTVSSFALAFIATGALMGALHWWIAIRPRRRWRLLQEQKRSARI